MTEEVILCGVICSVVFHNEDNGYAVLRLADEDGENVVPE